MTILRIIKLITIADKKAGHASGVTCFFLFATADRHSAWIAPKGETFGPGAGKTSQVMGRQSGWRLDLPARPLQGAMDLACASVQVPACFGQCAAVETQVQAGGGAGDGVKAAHQAGVTCQQAGE